MLDYIEIYNIVQQKLKGSVSKVLNIQNFSLQMNNICYLSF